MSVRRCSLSVVAVSCLVGLVAEPAYAQTDATASAPAVLPSAARQVFVSGGFPGVETSLTWAVLKDFTLSDANALQLALGEPSIRSTSKTGFNIAVTGNSSPWFGITAEGGGSFLKQGVPNFEGVLVAFEIQEWTVLVGPKFTLRTVRHVAPYVQFLTGAAFLNIEVPLAAFSASNWDFVLQPGAGVDLAVSDTLAVRLGFDGRLLSDRAFSGSTNNQFRFTLGVTFRAAPR